jgi:hypothetical protein
MEIYYRKFELIDDCLKRLEKIKKSNPNIDKYRAHLERVWVKMSYKLLIIYRKIREKRSFR